jgi:cell division protein ZapA
MAQSFRITLKIAGREYPLTIDPAQEWEYRKAAREINELVALYSKRYSADMENYLAMAALQTAMTGIRAGMSEGLESVMDELRAFDEELDRLPEARISGRPRKE